MKKVKLKIKKQGIMLILGIFLIILLIVVLIKLNNPKVGKIKNGKVEYIDRIVNVTYYKETDKIIIEFKNDKELIDNCFMTSEIYEKFKNNDPRYNLTVKDYFKLNDLSAKENYNINKALQKSYVKEDTIYTDYFTMTCGFKNKKELMKYTKAVMKINKKVGSSISVGK